MPGTNVVLSYVFCFYLYGKQRLGRLQWRERWDWKLLSPILSWFQRLFQTLTFLLRSDSQIFLTLLGVEFCLKCSRKACEVEGAETRMGLRSVAGSMERNTYSSLTGLSVSLFHQSDQNSDGSPVESPLGIQLVLGGMEIHLVYQTKYYGQDWQESSYCF